MSERKRVSIVGASGYTGGELLRVLLGHPGVEVAQVTSRSLVGQPVHRVHPNLRGHCDLFFSDPAELMACDAVFLCLPHGVASQTIDGYAAKTPLLVDLSADFRLRDAAAYRRWYEKDHARPDLLSSFVYGLPETRREELRRATRISGVGCNATAMTLALLPLVRAGVVRTAVADVKVGSSEAGAEPGASSHHPVRARAMRTFAATQHRHAAEVVQEAGECDLRVTVTAVEAVRGALATVHVLTSREVTKKEVWQWYRSAYQGEPFVRLVSEAQGLHRYPDPKVLLGSNHADVGFEVEEGGRRIVALCAIDNLMKGAAGSAVQAMNLAMGMDEKAGLWFPGLHPV